MTTCEGQLNFALGCPKYSFRSHSSRLLIKRGCGFTVGFFFVLVTVLLRDKIKQRLLKSLPSDEVYFRPSKCYIKITFTTACLKGIQKRIFRHFSFNFVSLCKESVSQMMLMQNAWNLNIEFKIFCFGPHRSIVTSICCPNKFYC